MKTKIKILCLIVSMICILSSCSSKSIGNWTGTYEYLYGYNSSSEENFRILHKLTIYEENNEYLGILEIDGWLVHVVIQTKIEGDADEIKIVYDKLLEGGFIGKEIEDQNGDVLFTLNYSQSELKTTWGTLDLSDDVGENTDKRFIKIN